MRNKIKTKIVWITVYYPGIDDMALNRVMLNSDGKCEERPPKSTKIKFFY